LIKRLTFLMEGAEGLAGCHNDAAGIQIRDSSFNGAVVKVEVNDYAITGEMPHCLGTVDNTSAGRDDGVAGIDGEYVILFDATEGLDADPVKDLLQALMLDGLYMNVGIEEVASEGLGQKDPDGALSDAAHAYQDDGLLVCIESVFHRGDFILLFTD